MRRPSRARSAAKSEAVEFARFVAQDSILEFLKPIFAALVVAVGVRLAHADWAAALLMGLGVALLAWFIVASVRFRRSHGFQERSVVAQAASVALGSDMAMQAMEDQRRIGLVTNPFGLVVKVFRDAEGVFHEKPSEEAYEAVLRAFRGVWQEVVGLNHFGGLGRPSERMTRLAESVRVVEERAISRSGGRSG